MSNKALIWIKAAFKRLKNYNNKYAKNDDFLGVFCECFWLGLFFVEGFRQVSRYGYFSKCLAIAVTQKNNITLCFISIKTENSGLVRLFSGVTKVHVIGAERENVHRKYTLFYLVKFN
jgi:hypothetical protein